ncbi:MAG: helix-turn-helix transcriptional regulator [Gammaproteobacteria bacterium]|nr:helix-turn-helix transcriptional regulator [Gammaproteobacteria bacterium]
MQGGDMNAGGSLRSVTLPPAEFVERAAVGLAPSYVGVLRAVDFVRDHYREKCAANLVATHCGLSRFQFSRCFHAVYGITFREYLLRYRIIAACHRLQESKVPVTEIAFSVGFRDGSYFARMFRRYTGVLPSQYARAHDSTTIR